MGKLQKSMTAYVKTLSKRNEGDDKEKSLPVSYLGSTMVSHGEDFEDDSEFGQCLQSKQHQGEWVVKLIMNRHGQGQRTDRQDTGNICSKCYHQLARVIGEIARSDEGIQRTLEAEAPSIVS